MPSSFPPGWKDLDPVEIASTLYPYLQMKQYKDNIKQYTANTPNSSQLALIDRLLSFFFIFFIFIISRLNRLSHDSFCGSTLLVSTAYNQNWRGCDFTSKILSCCFYSFITFRRVLSNKWCVHGVQLYPRQEVIINTFG